MFHKIKHSIEKNKAKLRLAGICLQFIKRKGGYAFLIKHKY